MRLGVDIMGGDYAPQYPLEGTIKALEQLPGDVSVVLFGDAQKIQSYLHEKHISDGRIEIVSTSEVIEMHEPPAQAFLQKQNSSITVGFQYLKAEKINSFASAGSTGAMMVGAMQVIKVIDGINRPCIASLIPKPDGNYSIIADVGLNPDAKPEVLNQYAIIASKYAHFILGIDNPKVALLNIGEESEKGNLLAKATYEMMKQNNSIHFIGNVEGFDILKNKADVIITDGFVGNVVLKLAEGFYSVMKKRNIDDDYLHKFNFENYGGTPVLGVNKPVIIGHGASTPKAIMNMILHSYKVTKAELVQKLKEAF